MFRPVAFEPHGGRRARRRVPRWLVLLAAGMLSGAGGLLYVQHNHLPPRLSAQESAQLRTAYEQADAERRSLQEALTQSRTQLDALGRERAQLQAAQQADRQTLTGLRAELASLLETLPPDPRGGTVQVRQARFSADGGRLQYQVTLARPRGVVGGSGTAAPLQAVMQLVVAGTPGRGGEARVRTDPQPVTLHAFDSVQGTFELPAGFAPRQASVQVLDKPDGRLLGMRVLPVK